MKKGKKTIIRLLKYRNALHRFKQLGFVKVFSDNLADATGSTSSQVRKDFSIYKIPGKRRGGYQIVDLLTSLNEILGKNEVYEVIIVGAGKLGTALMKYDGFEKEGMKIVAVFDIDPAKINIHAPVPILPMEEMRDFVKKNKITVGIIAVPDISAQQALDIMVSAGIRGIMNFAPIRMKCPDYVMVNSVNLALELENVIYFMSMLNK